MKKWCRHIWWKEGEWYHSSFPPHNKHYITPGWFLECKRIQIEIESFWKYCPICKAPRPTSRKKKK